MKTFLLVGTLTGVTVLLIYGSRKRLQHKKDYLFSLGISRNILDRMTAQEIDDTYRAVTWPENKPMTDQALKERLMIISTKYNIFT